MTTKGGAKFDGDGWVGRLKVKLGRVVVEGGCGLLWCWRKYDVCCEGL